MPKKSRRLPGGKVRKPLTQAPRRIAAGPVASAETMGEDVLDGEAAERTPQSRIAVAGAYPTPAAAPSSAARMMLGTGTGPAPTRSTTAAGVPRTGVAVRNRFTGSALPRQRTSLMELAASNYAHIRTDLARIAILAVIMLAIIFALSFVLK